MPTIRNHELLLNCRSALLATLKYLQELTKNEDIPKTIKDQAIIEQGNFRGAFPVVQLIMINSFTSICQK